MKFWKTFWACFLAIILSSLFSFFFSVIMFVSVVVSLSSLVGGDVQSGDVNGSVLVIDMGNNIVETTSDNVMDYLDFSTFEVNLPISIYNMRQAIERAAIDPMIKGIYIKFPLTFASTSTVLYELRKVLEDFKQQSPDKFIITYGDAYSQQGLYLASVADEVCVNPMGAVQWTGMAVMPMFYKKLLSKLGVEPQIIRHGKFKGAVEPFILDKLSEENRLQLQSMVDSNWDYMVSEIVQSRGVEAEKLFEAANNLSISTVEEALEYGLVDKLCYKDELNDWIDEQHGDSKAKFVELNQYSLQDQLNQSMAYSKNRVEVIYAQGSIVDESTGSSSSEIVGSELAARISKARKNDNIKAIVLRVDSPGGSAIASEVIAREVRLAVEDKPVVISMGEYAASGGYWISAPSTKIVASPLTLTGSIGVFGLMFSVEKGAEDILGITVDPVLSSTYADFGSLMRPFTPLERQVMQNSVNSIYDKFLVNVASGRDMTSEAVDEIGQGRVWTGLQGLENGLVDEIGTLNDAIELAALEAGISNDYSVISSKSKSNSPFSSLFGSVSVKLFTKIFPFAATEPLVEYIKGLEVENGTVQARFPYTLQYVR